VEPIEKTQNGSELLYLKVRTGYESEEGFLFRNGAPQNVILTAGNYERQLLRSRCRRFRLLSFYGGVFIISKIYYVDPRSWAPESARNPIDEKVGLVSQGLDLRLVDRG
jgi:hypothetical protein